MPTVPAQVRRVTLRARSTPRNKLFGRISVLIAGLQAVVAGLTQLAEVDLSVFWDMHRVSG
jgi:hypothetical protein